jgi:hypothetical protein
MIKILTYTFNDVLDFDIAQNKFVYNNYAFGHDLWSYELQDIDTKIYDDKVREILHKTFPSIEFDATQSQCFKFNDVADLTFFLVWKCDREIEIEI